MAVGVNAGWEPVWGLVPAVLSELRRPLIPTFSPHAGRRSARARNVGVCCPLLRCAHVAVDLAQSGPDKERAYRQNEHRTNKTDAALPEVRQAHALRAGHSR